MRGCFTLLLLMVLLGASAYSIWQVRLLRDDVDQLQASVLEGRRTAKDSMLKHARAAVNALERGDLERAQQELDRLADLMQQTQIMDGPRRERLRDTIEAAREAVARGGTKAIELLEELQRTLSRSEDTHSEERRQQTSEL